MFYKNKVSVLVVISTIWNICSCQEPSGIPNANLNFSYPEDITLRDGDTFDYVVVGAGAAGSAAAARLALAGERVLLVEAGGDPDLISHIPGLKNLLLGGNLDWKYPTIPNNISCLSSIGRNCRFSRGKCLGGSTAINFMIFTRGNPRDFDELNVPGWSWENLKPYFLRYEGFQNISRLSESSRPFHNTTGILKIDFFDSPQNPWQGRLIDGFQQLKIPFNGDVNGVSQIGVTRIAGYVYQGLRMSTARAYLANTQVKEKLNVTRHTFCTGLIIDNKKRVTGVKIVQNRQSFNVTKRIYVKKEVILSAGAIGTPQILMLSGIGPAKHLKEMRIPVRTDLPVGDNLSDHVLPLLFILVDRSEEIVDVMEMIMNQLASIPEFLITRRGPLASNSLTDVNLFVNTRCYDKSNGVSNATECEVPSTQMWLSYTTRGFVTQRKSAVQSSLSLDDEVVDQLAEKNAEFAFILVQSVVLKPFSRGTIRLTSRDPFEPPAIFPNYLSDSRDLDEMMRAFSIIEDLVESPAFNTYNASIFHLKFRDCPDYENDRNEYWRCYARHMTYSVFHAVGTAGLGTVVDERLSVKGKVCGLRVADLSVLPEIPRGNTEAVAVAIGERVVDMVLEDNPTKPNVIFSILTWFNNLF